MKMKRRVSSAASLLAISVWLGGLVAFGLATPALSALSGCGGAVAAVLEQFHGATLACVGVVLAAEIGGAVTGLPFGAVDRLRAAVAVFAAALAVFVSMRIGPSVRALYDAGANLGVGGPGADLAQWQATARMCGQAQVVLLVGLVVLHTVALSSTEEVGGKAAV